MSACDRIERSRVEGFGLAGFAHVNCQSLLSISEPDADSQILRGRAERPQRSYAAARKARNAPACEALRDEIEHRGLAAMRIDECRPDELREISLQASQPFGMLAARGKHLTRRGRPSQHNTHNTIAASHDVGSARRSLMPLARRLPDRPLRPLSCPGHHPPAWGLRPAGWAGDQSKHRQKPRPRRARRSALTWPVAIPRARSSRPITSRQTPISSAI